MSESLKSQLRVWLWGLAVAAVSATADAGVAFLAAPNLMMEHWRELWPVLLFAAARGVFLYMKQSPLPRLEY